MDVIWSNAHSTVYLVEGDEPRVRKELNRDFPDRRALRRLDNEVAVLEHLQERGVTGVRRYLGRGKSGARHFVEFGFVPGMTLSAFAASQPSLGELLAVAVEVADILHAVHQAGVIHRDVTSNNIIVDPTTGRATLIDFELATRVDLKRPYLGNPERIQGTLAYLSPEQTGRINRVVDRRSDLYSAGVVLYRALTGHLPFDSNDPMELVHSHIARVPEAPVSRRPELPQVLSDIVMKLLEKDADQRYASAWGLGRDLVRCRDAVRDGHWPAFQPGQSDHADRFHIPDVLYGRTEETQALLGAFERVSDGALELLLVSGYSGTGKTALVSETHRPVTQRRGYFVDGKFDQFKRNIPYFAFIRALEQFVQLLLTEDAATLARWAERIRGALGSEGAVLTEVIPSLKRVIGPQPPVAELAGKEAQNRFNWAFRRFIAAISRPEHPLVLFVDDLQWADSGSLDLLRLITTDPDNHYLLCIGAYRDNEVSPAHPFVHTVAAIEEAGVRVARVHTGNLRLDHVTALVADTLRCEPQRAASLAALILDKTDGNAFFVRQFLQSLHTEGLLSYTFDDDRWDWDVDAIAGRDLTDNVVELMARRMRRLPADATDLLVVAACLGDRFDRATLALTSGLDIDTLDVRLQDVLIEGLVVEVDDDTLRFVHDRVQQAAYSLLPVADRPAMHLGIGRLLRDHASADELEERLFDVVNQLDRGVDLLQHAEEREQLAELNLRAGRKARESAAYAPALEYLSVGIDLVPEDGWTSHYALVLALHREAAEAAYLDADFDVMERHVDLVLGNARDLLDRIPTYETRILAYKAQNRLDEAIDTGLEVLGQLGVTFPPVCDAAATGAALGAIQQLLSGHTIDELRELPPMTDPGMLGAMAIMADINSSVYWARAELFPFIVFKTVELSVQYGNCAVSSFAYSTYGVVLAGVLGAMRQANDYGRLGLDLLERFEAQAWMASTVCAHYVLIAPWNGHVRDAFEPLVRSVHRGLEIGNNEYAAINANNYLIMAQCIGAPLDALAGEYDSYSAMMKEQGQDTNYWFNQIYLQAVHNLQGRGAHTVDLIGEAYDETVMLPRHEAANDQTAVFHVHFNRMVLAFVFRDLAAAEVARRECEARLGAILAKIENASFRMLSSLILLDGFPDADEEGRRAILAAVDENCALLSGWAEAAPMNYRHKLQLVEAERHRVLGHRAAAHASYEAAIRGANTHDFLNEEALAYELAGYFFRDLDLPGVAEPYLRSAMKVYRQWEAGAKADALLDTFPELAHEPATHKAGRATTVSTVSTGTATLAGALDIDFASVMRAARAISSEINQDALLATTLRIVVENAGADRGVLVLGDQVEVEVTERGQRRLTGPLRGYPDIAQTVTDYVLRTGQPLLVDDPYASDPHGRDAHVRLTRPRAILAVPLRRKGESIGLIYLENRVTGGAFTRQRVQVIEALGTQAATSIENARVYDELEAKVAQRTEQLASATEQAEAASEAKTIFLRSMSHELRTPLNAVLGYAQLLLDGSSLTMPQTEGLQTIQRSGRHLLELINDILDVSKIEAGQLELNEAPLRLPALVRGVADLCRPAAQNKQLSLVTLVEPGLPEWVLGDERRIRQILLNLVSNALKFTDAGRVELTARSDDGIVCFEVVDTGHGIVADRIEAIFEPFEQAGPAAHRAKGTGLGLAISRRLARLMHGDLTVDSTVGQGSTFVARLPLPASEPPADDIELVVAPPPAPSVSRPLVYPDATALAELRELADSGSFSAVARKGEELAADPHLQAFAETLVALARDFDDAGIEALLEGA